MLKYSIVISVCDKPDLTKACLDSIEKYSENHEVIIIDNGSPVGMYSGDNVIRNEKNLGFPVAINQGILKATGEILVILNNDTVVGPHWLERLEAHFENYDMVGPLTNRISGPQQLSMNAQNLPEDLNFIAEAIYTQNKGQSIPFHRLVFFCVAIKREVFEKIGPLDEQFTPGNFEDDDFCLRAVDAGFRLGIANDCFIFHVGSATHKKLNFDHELLLRTNLVKFNQKYSPEKRAELIKKAVTNCAENPPQRKKTLALVMVVKDEEKGLERAILSAKPIVDQIIIAVDRASKDKTAEIAEKYADEVKYFDWCDDFAWARNFAHAGVETDWILFLDGHEYIKKCDNLSMMLMSPADGLLCTVELETGTEIRNPRIYKNGLKFEGAIHEIQNCKTLAVYSDFLVMHGRLDGQADDSIAFRKQQTNDQIPRIMGKQLKDDPTNTRASFHLALHLQSQGDFRGALKYYKKYFKYSKHAGERWYMFFNQALCHFSLGHTLRALWATDNANKETPRRWEIAKLRGLIFYNSKNFKKAIENFVNSFDDNLGDVTYKPWKRDNSEVWNLIGQSYFQLQRPDLAGEAFEQAWKLCEKSENKKLLFDRFKIMQKLSRGL